MSGRQGLASLLWVVSFNLCVAAIAIYWGIGWSIAILFLRHILLGIPKVYDLWRGLFLTPAASTMIEKANQRWPNQTWLLETVLLVIVAVIIIVWFNIPLKNYLFSS